MHNDAKKAVLFTMYKCGFYAEFICSTWVYVIRVQYSSDVIANTIYCI